MTKVLLSKYVAKYQLLEYRGISLAISVLRRNLKTISDVGSYHDWDTDNEYMYWYCNSLTRLSTVLAIIVLVSFDCLKPSLWFDDKWNCSYCWVNFYIWFIAAELLTPDEMYTGNMIHAHPRIRNTTYKRKYMYTAFFAVSVIFVMYTLQPKVAKEHVLNFCISICFCSYHLSSRATTLCCTKEV